jgi:hypothetical protein
LDKSFSNVAECVVIHPSAVEIIDTLGVTHVQGAGIVAGHTIAWYRVVEQAVAVAVGFNHDVVARVLLT